MKYNQFTSTGFVLSLSLLLLNDFCLKAIYGNWFTGKLSDFAGLFVFPLFWTILFPRFKNKIYFATAVIFIYWKSSYSEPLLQMVNSFSTLNFIRVADFTDLVALSILPFSYTYHEKKDKTFLRINPAFIVVVASFSFIATSYNSEIEYHKTYTFNYSLDSLKTRIYYLETISNEYEIEKEKYILDSTGKYKIHRNNWDTIDAKLPPIDKFFKDRRELFVYEDFCFKGYTAIVAITGDSINSSIEVLGFQHVCPKNENWQNDEKILSKSFEKKVINQLR